MVVERSRESVLSRASRAHKIPRGYCRPICIMPRFSHRSSCHLSYHPDRYRRNCRCDRAHLRVLPATGRISPEDISVACATLLFEKQTNRYRTRSLKCTSMTRLFCFFFFFFFDISLRLLVPLCTASKRSSCSHNGNYLANRLCDIAYVFIFPSELFVTFFFCFLV